MKKACLLTLALIGAACAQTPAPLTLDQIMADPDWIGNAPESPFISADSRSVYFQRKENGSDLRALWRVPIGGGPQNATIRSGAGGESTIYGLTSERRRST